MLLEHILCDEKKHKIKYLTFAQNEKILGELYLLTTFSLNLTIIFPLCKIILSKPTQYIVCFLLL